MSAQQLEQILHTIPFPAMLGVSVEDHRPGHVVLRLPAWTSNTNAAGALHSGALFTIAELAAGVALGTHPRLAGLRHRQLGTGIKYRRAASADVTAHATVTNDMVTAIEGSLQSGREARLELTVRVMDGHGQDVAHVVTAFAFVR